MEGLYGIVVISFIIYWFIIQGDNDYGINHLGPDNLPVFNCILAHTLNIITAVSLWFDFWFLCARLFG